MIGKGSMNHNSRKFTAENVDKTRSKNNISYCNRDIKEVYHELFDDAVKRFNDKQKRADRKITNYYEKICSSKQEKPFKEVIIQIGNSEDMSAMDNNGELAKKILDKYYSAFQKRNPYLKVFSAHLHMDEATPHLHIDFVPFTTESTRGLDKRVSLKQALAKQGFKGSGRSDTEWNQWVLSEKKELEFVMGLYGVEWEHKGTHEEHLSVLNYKKQEREKEISVLDDKIKERQEEYHSLNQRIENKETQISELNEIEDMLENSPEFQLPEPTALMTAKSYKTKYVDPLIKKLKDFAKWILSKTYEGWDNYYKAHRQNNKWSRENSELRADNNRLYEECNKLHKQNEEYELLLKTFGRRKFEPLLRQAYDHLHKRQNKHYKDYYERLTIKSQV